MKDNEPKPTIKLELSKEEQQTILQFCKMYSAENYSKIAGSSDGVVMLSEIDADILVGELHWIIPATRNENVKSILIEIADRIPVSPDMARVIGRSTKGDCKKPNNDS